MSGSPCTCGPMATISKSTAADHMPSSHRRYADWHVDYRAARGLAARCSKSSPRAPGSMPTVRANWRRQELARLGARPQSLPRQPLGPLQAHFQALRRPRARPRRSPLCPYPAGARRRAAAHPRRLGARAPDAAARHDLLEMSRRQMARADRRSYLGDAIVDRIVHNCHWINLTGHSLRRSRDTRHPRIDRPNKCLCGFRRSRPGIPRWSEHRATWRFEDSSWLTIFCRRPGASGVVLGDGLERACSRGCGRACNNARGVSVHIYGARKATGRADHSSVLEIREAASKRVIRSQGGRRPWNRRSQHRRAHRPLYQLDLTVSAQSARASCLRLGRVHRG
jgi:hypothetical protein